MERKEVQDDEATPKKVDLRRDLKHLYRPSAKKVSLMDVPEMNFLMVDGEGDPNTSEWYKAAVEVLYAISYELTFMVKKGEEIDYGVMSLKGLWWADDMSRFSVEDKNAWKWSMMTMQPEFTTETMAEEARRQVEKKRRTLPAISKMRFGSFCEGPSAQTMHLGPYSEEGPTIRRLRGSIAGQTRETRKHHEIYFGDPRHTVAGRLKTASASLWELPDEVRVAANPPPVI